MEAILSGILAFLIAAVHFLGEELEDYIGGYRETIVSFSAGVSVTYIFMELLPEFQRIVLETSNMMFAFPLIGFSSIHVVEKYIAKSGFEKARMRKDFAEIHSIFLFVYYGAIGYLLALLISNRPASGLLFFIPVIFHSAVSSLSVTELDEKFTRKGIVKVVISTAPILGVLVYSAEFFSKELFNPIFGLIVGMFFYVVIRGSIPIKDKGKPVEYTAGVILYLVIILTVALI